MYFQVVHIICLDIHVQWSVFEIKLLFCAHIGCRGTQNRATGDILCAQVYIMYRNILKYGALTGCTCIKMCAPGTQKVHTGCRVHP